MLTDWLIYLDYLEENNHNTSFLRLITPIIFGIFETHCYNYFYCPGFGYGYGYINGNGYGYGFGNGFGNGYGDGDGFGNGYSNSNTYNIWDVSSYDEEH